MSSYFTELTTVARPLGDSIEIILQPVINVGKCTYCQVDSPKLRVFGDYKPACRDCYCQCVADGVTGSLSRISETYNNPNILAQTREILNISPKFRTGIIGKMAIDAEDCKK